MGSTPGDATSDWFLGQTAVVTGAAHGIGRATAELLASLGARVIVVDSDRAALEEQFRDGRYVRWCANLGSGEDSQLAADICDRYGPVPLIVNNVGISTPRRFLELEDEEFDRVFATNLRCPWFFTKRLVAQLTTAGRGGALVFVSSVHDDVVFGRPHYSASKAAIAMLVKELAVELGGQGVRVNAVSPGSIRTASNPMTDPEGQARVGRLVPLRRMGEPVDVARMIAVLLSDRWSGYVTGANVRVDGGLALRNWTTGAAPDDRAARGRGLLGRARRRVVSRSRPG
ncbi:MAG: SDR family NAD(P)-dependent oxidoreductase [Solirubrobacteraceae bacterium]